MSATIKVKINDNWYKVKVGDLKSDPVVVLVDGQPVKIIGSKPVDDSVDMRSVSNTSNATIESPGILSTEHVFRAPMPGTVLSVAVNIGDEVTAGDEICILEAMKMQQSLRAEDDGVVSEIYVSAQQQVLDGDPIIKF